MDARELGRLRWRCRRGMRELDFLLERYLERRFPLASPEQQQAFRRLLEAEDTEIHGLCLGRRAAPSAPIAALIERITAPDGEDAPVPRASDC